jgi:hypothetical protein
LGFCADIAAAANRELRNEGEVVDEVDAGRYRYMAELFLGLHPKSKPTGQPPDLTYRSGLNKQAGRLRKNADYWEKEVRDRLFPPPGES